MTPKDQKKDLTITKIHDITKPCPDKKALQDKIKTHSNTAYYYIVSPKNIKDEAVSLAIWEHWNKKKIIVHRRPHFCLPAIRGALQYYSPAELITAIDNYAIVLEDPDCYLEHKFTLKRFLTTAGTAQIDSFLDLDEAIELFLRFKIKNDNLDEIHKDSDRQYDEDRRGFVV